MTTPADRATSGQVSLAQQEWNEMLKRYYQEKMSYFPLGGEKVAAMWNSCKSYCEYGLAYVQPFFAPYTLRGRIQQVNLLAAKGEAENIETVYVCEPANFPRLIKKAHIIVSSKSVAEGLKNDQLKQSTSTPPTVLDDRLGRDNMLLCPYNEHLRLRSPLEKSFSKKEVLKFTPEIIKIIVMDALSTCFVKKPPLVAEKTIDEFTGGKEKALFAIEEKDRSALHKILVEATVKERGALTEKEASQTLALLRAAGQHTTSVTITFLLQLLKAHPEVVKEIKKEWESFTKENPIKDLNDLVEKLKVFALGEKVEGVNGSFSLWLNGAVKETFRLYPAVSDVPRTVDQDCEFEGITLKAGELVIFDILGAQRNSSDWENSNKFMPERFLDDKRSFWQSHEPLVCFSAASKKCLGQELAKLEVMMVGALYSLFSIEQPDDEEEIKSEEPLFGFTEPSFLVSHQPQIDKFNAFGLLNSYSLTELVDFVSKEKSSEIVKLMESRFRNMDCLRVKEKIPAENLYPLLEDLSIYYEYKGIVDCQALIALVNCTPEQKKLLIRFCVRFSILIENGITVGQLLSLPESKLELIFNQCSKFSCLIKLLGVVEPLLLLSESQLEIILNYDIQFLHLKTQGQASVEKLIKKLIQKLS